MRKEIPILLTVISQCLMACSGSDKPVGTDTHQANATARDFFFYSCVREYLKANAIKDFDGSVAYAVEHSRLSAEELNRLYESAKTFARSIPAPDFSDEEHGRQAVLMLCEREAGKYTNQ